MLCDHCEKRPAVCRGSYDNGPMSYACDECCGHGCEGGKCEHLTTLLWRAEAQLAERTRERDEVIERLRNTAGILIGTMGATGPEDADSVATRAVLRIAADESRIARITTDRDTAIARAEKAERERDEARSALDAETYANDMANQAMAQGVANTINSVASERDDARAEVGRLREALDAADGRRREGRQLLRRMVKYAREDRAVTPGVTRLQRLVDTVDDYLKRTGEPSDILRARQALAKETT